MPLVVVLFAWGLIIGLVNPVGEFMVNDDWSFVESHRALFREGRLIPTGWGQGGPSLIFHLLWGELFTRIFGDSVTTLRLSVMFLGIVGSCGFLVLLKDLGLSRWQSLLWAMLVTLNPLYLSLCFSYMTDITFVALLILALVAIQRAQSNASTKWFLAGLLLSVAAILTRQIGLAIPLGFFFAVLSCLRQWPLGLIRSGLLLVAFTIVPWLSWEWTLQSLGSTPVVRHEVLTNIWTQLAGGHWLDYVLSLGSRVGVILLYVGFFLSPFWIWSLSSWLRFPRVSRSVQVYGAAFVLFELAVLSGLVHPPVGFHRNVITNFGLGPLLFKDSYLLGVPALTPIPPALFYFLVFVAIPGAVLIAVESILFLKRVASNDQDGSPRFVSVFLWFTAASYSFVIVLTGFHDRYLIPLVVLFLGWFAAEERSRPSLTGPLPIAWLKGTSAVLFVGLGLFSVLATHDFVATRRAADQAHQFLLTELRVDPCNVDGGFEFNGFRCRWRVKDKKAGLSWWWVEREDYLVCLSPLPTYEVLRAYPIRRWLGRDGQVYVLKPIAR